MQTKITFNRATTTRKVNRRLRDYCVLSRAIDRDLVIEVPTRGGDLELNKERVRELANKIATGDA